MKLKQLTPTSGKKPQGEERYKEPSGKGMSLIGKGKEWYQGVTW
jgi:hypothetical protein